MTSRSTDPAFAFIEAAIVPRDAHGSGTLEEAEAIRAQHPEVATSSIYAAALLADEPAVRAFLASDPAAKGGPREWDALTHLCFSRYLRLDRNRADAFVRTARALLDAGASANTGWIEMIDHPNPRPVLESAIYGAAGIAQHAGLTRLLLERGADPNDEETAYHVAETTDNTVLKILLESGRLNETSMGTPLVRKCDWHDPEGLRLVLKYGGSPTRMSIWGKTALHQSVLRDNGAGMIEMLLEHGADPTIPNRAGRSAIVIAARRGRGDALDLFEKHGFSVRLTGVDGLIAACARNRKEDIDVRLKSELMEKSGTVLAKFAGAGNLDGVRNLLDLGVDVNALYREGDAYFDVAKDSTALHVAAWRARHRVVEHLIARGANVHARDAKGQTPIQLAVKACVDSHWMRLRAPDSVRAFLDAGASSDGIQLPSGYGKVDRLLQTS